MKLSRDDYAFVNPKICYVDPKLVELDRVMINLYMLLKYNGLRPVPRTGRGVVDIDFIFNSLLDQHADKLKGFDEYSEIVKDWIYSDLVNIVFRGNADKETLSAPLPLHLNAYKLRNPKHVRDYRSADQLFSMIRYADPDLVKRLANFLGQGMDTTQYDTYDEETPLDLDTLMIVRMVDNPGLEEKPSSRGSLVENPLCAGQARLMANDLRRLLAYEDVVPRPVLIGYLKTAMGFHLGLYLLRLFHQVSGWLNDKAAHPDCLNCPVRPEQNELFHRCPYAFQNQLSDNQRLFEILIDMGDDYRTHMAQLSRENCARHYASINEYIHATFTINQIFRYASSHAGRRQLSTQVDTVHDVLDVIKNPPEGLNHYFSERIDSILPIQELQDEKPEVLAIRDMEGLNPLEIFIELVSLERTKYFRSYMTQQLDAVFMKNKDTCLLRQGKGRQNERRWHIGSRLLEIFVQIAVLEPKGTMVSTGFQSKSILIDEFVNWLKERYGLVLVPDWPDATIEDYEAFNQNMRLLKDRLREIGFYTDLSDAYNAQSIRPRYTIS